MVDIKNRDDLRELRARAIFDAAYGHIDNWDNPHTPNEKTKERFRKFAEATMKAEEGAGLALVSWQLTEEMDLQACEADHADWSSSNTGDQSDSIRDIYNAAITTGNLLKIGKE